MRNYNALLYMLKDSMFSCQMRFYGKNEVNLIIDDLILAEPFGQDWPRQCNFEEFTSHKFCVCDN